MSSRSEAEERLSFETYLKYVRAWAHLVDQGSTPLEWVDGTGPETDRATGIDSHLRRSWSQLTALAYLASVGVGEVLPAAPPLAYYSVHDALQGFFLARGMAQARKHESAMNAATKVCHVLSQPWDATYKGPSGSGTWGGSAESWGYPASSASDYRTYPPEAWAAMSLKTTRDQRIRRAVEHERGSAKKVKRGFAKQQQAKPLTTSVFDFLYRLRIRAHYQRPERFLFGPDEDAVEMIGLLFTLANKTCLELERHCIVLTGSSKHSDSLFAFEARATDRGGRGGGLHPEVFDPRCVAPF